MPPPQGPGGGRRRRGPVIATAIVAGVALVIVGAGLGWAGSTLVGSINRDPIKLSPQASQNNGNSGNSGSSLASQVDPWVVDVNTNVETANGSEQAAGSGIILTSDGEVLTNNHVVEGATSISVVIQGHSQSYTAEVVGVDPTVDVALIQIEGVSGLPTAKLADSSTVKVGEVIADFGNACGQGGTPVGTTGSVTALNQSITAEDDDGSAENLTGMLGTSDPIVPGDSGSPLVNSAGQVVAMVTAGNGNGCGNSGGSSNNGGGYDGNGGNGSYVPGSGGSGYQGGGDNGGNGQSGNSSTVGYAIPTNKAISIIDQIRKGDASSTVILGQVGFLGVDVEDLTAQSAQQLGLSVSSGALIAGFATPSAASQAGIPQYSVITAVDGNSVTSAATLGTVLQQYKPGQQVQVTWASQSGSHTTEVTLGTGPAV
ncbi:MAG TPA: trypsin-like peptidase domain-containing protein [Candidatus Dormibacteraeota bacterium]|jgi:S1-C subfamily serine protease|nr:trypsin-like peptidase domain-containing protein [Candidatus Dormibacteraeota bacterium]